MAQQTLTDKTWFKATAGALLTGVISLIVSSVTATWWTRDYLDKRDQTLAEMLRRERAEVLTRYVSREEWQRQQLQDQRELNSRLDALAERYRR